MDLSNFDYSEMVCCTSYFYKLVSLLRGGWDTYLSVRPYMAAWDIFGE